MKEKNAIEVFKPKPKEDPISYIKRDEVKKRIEEIMGQKAPLFIASITSAISTNPHLKQCDGKSVVSASLIAATLDLPINQSLGFAYIIPYSGYAQFQMGYKGYIQLAMRSGQYKTINVAEVYEGEIEEYNKFTGDFKFGKKKSDKIIGYIAYFKLINGFEKYLFMTTEDIEKHAYKYSQSYKKGYGLWKDDFDLMAKKTVLKMLLSKYGVLSVEMQKAISTDQAVVIDENKMEYIDNSNIEEERQTVVKLKKPRKSKKQKEESKTEEAEEKPIGENRIEELPETPIEFQ